MDLSNWLLLRPLRKAIQKVKFLLVFNVHKWGHVSTLIGSPSCRRQLSFSDPAGLLDCTGDTSVHEWEMVRSPVPIRRTASDADDINRRADVFIANFHRHIQMERQVSLELRYTGTRGN